MDAAFRVLPRVCVQSCLIVDTVKVCGTGEQQLRGRLGGDLYEAVIRKSREYSALMGRAVRAAVNASLIPGGVLGFKHDFAFTG